MKFQPSLDYKKHSSKFIHGYNGTAKLTSLIEYQTFDGIC